MGFVFLLSCVLVVPLILAYLESPNYERNQMVNRLVKESKRRKKEREHKPKRGYIHVQAGWRI